MVCHGLLIEDVLLTVAASSDEYQDDQFLFEEAPCFTLIVGYRGRRHQPQTGISRRALIYPHVYVVMRVQLPLSTFILVNLCCFF